METTTQLNTFIWFRVVPVHPGHVTSDYGVHEVGVTVCGVQHVLGVRVRRYKQSRTNILNEQLTN